MPLSMISFRMRNINPLNINFFFSVVEKKFKASVPMFYIILKAYIFASQINLNFEDVIISLGVMPYRNFYFTDNSSFRAIVGRSYW